MAPLHLKTRPPKLLSSLARLSCRNGAMRCAFCALTVLNLGYRFHPRLLRKLSAGLGFLAPILHAFDVVHRAFGDDLGKHEIRDVLDFPVLQGRRRVGHTLAGLSQIGLLEAVATAVVYANLSNGGMPVPGRPHLMVMIRAARSRRVSRRLAPSGICVSILRPSPAQPWQDWQLPFCRNRRAPSAISLASGAWAARCTGAASSMSASAANVSAAPWIGDGRVAWPL